MNTLIGKAQAMFDSKRQRDSCSALHLTLRSIAVGYFCGISECIRSTNKILIKGLIDILSLSEGPNKDKYRKNKRWSVI